MIRVTDQLGAEVTLNHPAERIISLVPSQTELLHYLGLNEQVIGITKFCIHPESWFRNKTRVGGTKDFKTDLIRSMNPDLVLANKEENDRERLEELAEFHPVWTSDIHTLDQALEMVKAIGKLTATETAADALVSECYSNFNKLNKISSIKNALYFIWSKPWMCAGNDTFIDDMMQRCGLKNACDAARYPTLSLEEIKKINPELILLSSEPFPFKKKHADELREVLPATKILFVDGEYFSWYGSRMKDAPGYFEKLIAEIDQ